MKKSFMTFQLADNRTEDLLDLTVNVVYDVVDFWGNI